MPTVIDDGTMDTVIKCECGRVRRFTQDYSGETSGMDDNDNTEDIESYEAFMLDCLAIIAYDCECGE